MTFHSRRFHSTSSSKMISKLFLSSDQNARRFALPASSTPRRPCQICLHLRQPRYLDKIGTNHTSRRGSCEDKGAIMAISKNAFHVVKFFCKNDLYLLPFPFTCTAEMEWHRPTLGMRTVGGKKIDSDRLPVELVFFLAAC